jgi:hypothetical protein
METSSVAEKALHFASAGRFYPKMDDWITQSDILRQRKKVTRAMLKSYAMVASGGDYLETCKCSKFTQQCAIMCGSTGFSPAAIASIFSRTNADGSTDKVRFRLDDQERGFVVTKHGATWQLPISNCVLMARIGIADLLMFTQCQQILQSNYPDLTLKEFLFLPAYQFSVLAWLLDAALVANKGNFKAAACDVRADSDNVENLEFGSKVWKAHNRLIASGHSLTL